MAATAMAQFEIYGREEYLREQHARISELVHGAAVRTLGLPPDKRFQRFLPLASWQLVAPADRSERYLIIEAYLFTGRSSTTRKALIRALLDDLSRELMLSPNDIEVTLFEAPRENWGIRGQHGDEPQLSYPVDV
jgi:phenylpyruvate tautomerase PptA (4-oxalocrotonate tautomerase family)